ncbi:MAG: hypothetical protein H6Q43_753 [Deltaproteobacteria bacterium]|nr:hypothetical protein [Deltaproteobacteria bacterium]MBP1717315.1 hypothetical protein [Deltaproteobacteria bacterium]
MGFQIVRAIHESPHCSWAFLMIYLILYLRLSAAI